MIYTILLYHIVIQDIVIGPTIRESDGLAMSSRNRYLSPQERAIAPILYKAMHAAEMAFNNGVYSRNELIHIMDKVLAESSNLVEAQYWSIADPFELDELDVVDARMGAILSGAILVGKTRIIDNVLLGMKTSKL